MASFFQEGLNPLTRRVVNPGGGRRSFACLGREGGDFSEVLLAPRSPFPQAEERKEKARDFGEGDGWEGVGGDEEEEEEEAEGRGGELGGEENGEGPSLELLGEGTRPIFPPNLFAQEG